MKSLEQVFGKVKQKRAKRPAKQQETPEQYQSRDMSLTGPCGAYRLTWKLKHDHWFLCEGSQGWYRLFMDCYTESAFRQWLKHHPNHHYIWPLDNYPPFRLLEPKTTKLDSLAPLIGEQDRPGQAHSSPVK